MDLFREWISLLNRQIIKLIPQGSRVFFKNPHYSTNSLISMGENTYFQGRQVQIVLINVGGEAHGTGRRLGQGERSPKTRSPNDFNI